MFVSILNKNDNPKENKTSEKIYEVNQSINRYFSSACFFYI
ncbi:MAG: hypothetical protein Q8930_00700 [Bacillota bacterium]|nr:hypothetical protein [Bacillota bacterium]